MQQDLLEETYLEKIIEKVENGEKYSEPELLRLTRDILRKDYDRLSLKASYNKVHRQALDEVSDNCRRTRTPKYNKMQYECFWELTHIIETVKAIKKHNYNLENMYITLHRPYKERLYYKYIIQVFNVYLGISEDNEWDEFQKYESEFQKEISSYDKWVNRYEDGKRVFTDAQIINASKRVNPDFELPKELDEEQKLHDKKIKGLQKKMVDSIMKVVRKYSNTTNEESPSPQNEVMTEEVSIETNESPELIEDSSVSKEDEIDKHCKDIYKLLGDYVTNYSPEKIKTIINHKLNDTPLGIIKGTQHIALRYKDKSDRVMIQKDAHKLAECFALSKEAANKFIRMETKNNKRESINFPTKLNDFIASEDYCEYNEVLFIIRNGHLNALDPDKFPFLE